MRKLLFASLLLLVASASGQGQKPVSCLVKGDLTGLNVQEAILIPYDKDLRFEGIKIPIQDNKFEYVLQTNTIQAYELMVPTDFGFYYVAFFPEAEGVEVVCNPKVHSNLQKLSVVPRGPRNQEMADCLEAEYAAFGTRQDSLSALQDQLFATEKLFTPEITSIRKLLSQATDRPTIDSLLKEETRREQECEKYTVEGQAVIAATTLLGKERERWYRDYIAEHPSLSTFYHLITKTKSAQQHKEDLSPWMEIYDRHFASLFPGHPFHASMAEIRQHMTMVAGAKYIDSTLSDTEGRATKIAEIIGGKVALIDLWASWCGSCRKHSISVIPVYEKYKDKGFTVVGIAREYKNDQAWRAALKRDGYPWRNLIELDNQHNLWAQYGLGNGGGGSFLVDRNGTILAVNPSAKQIEAILENELD